MRGCVSLQECLQRSFSTTPTACPLSLEEFEMTNDRNASPAADRNWGHRENVDQDNELWDALATKLLGCLDGLAGAEEGDYLRLELVGPRSGDAAPNYYPYVQFSSTGVLGELRAEIPGKVLIHPLYRLDRDQCTALRQMGWFGNDPSREIDWNLEFVDDDSEEVAQQAVLILRDYFGIAHPQLLTFRESGFVDDLDEQLGLCASVNVPLDKPTVATFRKAEDSTGTGTSAQTFVARNHAELVSLVAETLVHFLDDEPETDHDGDFVLHHMNQVVWVRVLQHQPGVEILARIANGVRSPRGAAVEISILNRDSAWVTWSLRDRDIWQSILIPALPFSPAHLDALLKVFLRAMSATRDDLALRTGARVG